MERERIERILRIMLRNKIKEMNEENIPIELKEIYIKGFTDCMEKITDTFKERE